MSVQSRLLMENMNDIVWSMKASAINNTTLEAKIKNFGSELLSDKNIDFTYLIYDDVEKILQSINARKNILLICKEAMNNIAKYSQATAASLLITTNNDMLELSISDNGVGFNVTKFTSGNGLKNMQNRISELKGIIHFTSIINEGTTIKANIPLKVLY